MGLYLRLPCEAPGAGVLSFSRLKSQTEKKTNNKKTKKKRKKISGKHQGKSTLCV